MVAMLKKLQSDVGAEHAVCVFDASGPTFRDEWYPEYKAQRSPMPPELRAQIEPIHEVVKLLGWPTLTVPGVEADDVIGTLCCIGAAQGHKHDRVHRRQGLVAAGEPGRGTHQHDERRAAGRGRACWRSSACPPIASSTT